MSGETGEAANAKLLNHLALHYRPGDGDLVARFFRSLGLRVEDIGPGRHGDRAFRVVLNAKAPDGFFFVSTATAAQLAFEDALGRLGPDLGAYLEARAKDPEAGFHLGIRYESLEALEHALERLDELMRDESRLAGRCRVTRMKAVSTTDPLVSERMAASTVFQASDRDAFGEGIVQVFVQTHLAAGGPLVLGQTIELDYAFPGRKAAYAPEKVYEDA